MKDIENKINNQLIYSIVILLHLLITEYNPLMGDGSRGYRPPKRSCCKKGGCG